MNYCGSLDCPLKHPESLSVTANHKASPLISTASFSSPRHHVRSFPISTPTSPLDASTCCHAVSMAGLCQELNLMPLASGARIMSLIRPNSWTQQGVWLTVARATCWEEGLRPDARTTSKLRAVRARRGERLRRRGTSCSGGAARSKEGHTATKGPQRRISGHACATRNQGYRGEDASEHLATNKQGRKGNCHKGQRQNDPQRPRNKLWSDAWLVAVRHQFGRRRCALSQPKPAHTTMRHPKSHQGTLNPLGSR